jgi:hypothetical protein
MSLNFEVPHILIAHQDCDRIRLKEALTGDRHFEQAGFQPLFKN